MTESILLSAKYQTSAVSTLKQCLASDLVDAVDRKFVTSLLVQHKSKGSLSEKQWVWIEKMVKRAIGIKELANFGGPIQVGSSANHAGSPDKLFNLFATAQQKLKSPKLTFGCWWSDAGNDGAAKSMVEIKIYPVSYQGTITALQVALANKYPGYLGSIYPSSEIVFAAGLNPEAIEYLCALYTDLFANPHKAVSAQGKFTCKCCFCNLPLSDEQSVAHGYGKTCASHWGLPYGNKKNA